MRVIQQLMDELPYDATWSHAATYKPSRRDRRVLKLVEGVGQGYKQDLLAAKRLLRKKKKT